MNRRSTAVFFFLVWSLPACGSARCFGQVRFGRDVLPILSENCFACHGPDPARRKADLRLDTREGALAAMDLKTPASSELLARVASDDPSELMPPPSSHKTRLTSKQIDVLKKWIEGGAPWGAHWSFEKPTKVDPPKIAPHPIDAFVRERLRTEGLAPSPPAPLHTIARRVSFDLTGMPPSPAELDAFLGDARESGLDGAYGRYVDRLLASPHFGERMAAWWLDAARYADTDGFQGDETRTNWPWRDWVVDAFNRNMPYDRFTIEQFAGDLLPNATPEQKLATCFHRNHMTNGEGGRDPEESRVDYVIDRVNTTGALWLGLTLGCAQCHSHKYDPISHKDYYSLSAFFNSIDEDGRAGKGAKPYLSYRSKAAEPDVAEARRLVEERKARLVAAEAEARSPFEGWLAERFREVRNGFSAWRPLVPAVLASAEGTTLTAEPDGKVQASGTNPRQDDYRIVASLKSSRVTGVKLEIFPHPSHAGGAYSRGASGEFILTDVKVQIERAGSSQVRDVTLANATADVSAEQKEAREYGDVKGTLDDDPRNGWTTKGRDRKGPHVAVFAFAEPWTPAPDERIVVELRQRSTVGDANIGRFRLSTTDQPGPAVLSVEATPLERLARIKELDALDKPLRELLFEQFLADHAPRRAAKAALARAERQKAEVEKAAKPLDVMVLAERKTPRSSHVLIRGVWDAKGEAVGPDVPAAVAPWPGDAARDRLNLARWLVSKENPLAARVAVNHLWQLLFGAGLVRTPEDLGLQGERPTHPELLDRLAVDFVESGWDVKRMMRFIVMSETYRQSSNVDAERLARDPENRLLARAPRFRLPSWMLRDSALKLSGLLDPTIGGPPVRPDQPDGVWEEMFMGRFRYEPSEGSGRRRRTIYAFWRRAIAPTFLFDSAQRRVCEVRVARTNTPSHALAVLNDVNFLIAARALAEAANDPDTIFKRVLGREPSKSESALIRREHDRALAHYRARPDDASKFLAVAAIDRESPSKPDAPLAARTVVASLILNLDEALNHE